MLQKGPIEEVPPSQRESAWLSLQANHPEKDISQVCFCLRVVPFKVGLIRLHVMKVFKPLNDWLVSGKIEQWKFGPAQFEAKSAWIFSKIGGWSKWVYFTDWWHFSTARYHQAESCTGPV